jgi:hypothetical protein
MAPSRSITPPTAPGARGTTSDRRTTPVQALRAGLRRLLGRPSDHQLDVVNAALRTARRREAEARERARALEADVRRARRSEAAARAEADEQRERAEVSEMIAMEAYETLDRQARLLGGRAVPLSEELCRETSTRARARDDMA